MSLYTYAIVQPTKMLQNLDKWLEAAVAHAQKKSFDPNGLLTARLAPDQFALARQVQSSCDVAKLNAARLTGKEAPKHPDTEQTVDELRARVRTVVEYLGTFTEADLAGAETRHVELSFMPGKYILGADYLREFGQPNFYFHVSMTYALLRHNGVDLGKRDYLGAITLHDR